MADSLILAPALPSPGLGSSMKGSSSAILGGVLMRRSLSRLREDGRCERAGAVFASCSFQATALRSRIRLASVTRRLKSGSVASVRKVSLRILV
jgi:hypothetical protein